MNPLFAITLDSPTLLGIAAVVSAIGGIVTTIVAVRKSRNEEYEHALEQLKETRAEAETLAEELHELRMRKIEEGQAHEVEHDSDNGGGSGVRRRWWTRRSGGTGSDGGADEDGDDRRGQGGEG